MAGESNTKAALAQAVLDNEVFQEAFDSFIDGTVETIAKTPIADSESRNQLGLLLVAAEGFKSSLYELITTYKLDRDDEMERAKRQLGNGLSGQETEY